MRQPAFLRVLLTMLAVLTLLAPSGVDAKPKRLTNGCTDQQIQSAAATQCINKMQDDILHNRSTFHALYCSSTGKMLCCQYDQSGNTIDHSCDIIETRANPFDTVPLTPGGDLEIAPPPGPSSHAPDKQGVDGIDEISSGDAISIPPLFIRPLADRPSLAIVKTICIRVKGIFGSNASGFACTATDCDGNGSNCTIACTDRKCFAATPSRLTRPTSLLGILQNGDNRVRDDLTSGEPNQHESVDPPVILY